MFSFTRDEMWRMSLVDMLIMRCECIYVKGNLDRGHGHSPRTYSNSNINMSSPPDPPLA